MAQGTLSFGSLGWRRRRGACGAVAMRETRW